MTRLVFRGTSEGHGGIGSRHDRPGDSIEDCGSVRAVARATPSSIAAQLAEASATRSSPTFSSSAIAGSSVSLKRNK